ncbi:heavy metal translocating P-type ATPase [bacterium]|nr:heavy metal translocating P-type ATPase [bacterium]
MKSPDHDSQLCHYCSLPVVGTASDDGPAYCCFGCRFAAQMTGATGEQGEARWMATTLGLSVFCTMNVVMMTMALWSYADQAQTPFEAGLADFLRYGGLLFSAPVVLLLGQALAINAVEQLRRGQLSTDLLLLTGVIAAFIVSVVATVRAQSHVYFEVSCVILVLVTLGRWLEATGRLQASSALDELEQLIPATIRCVCKDGFTYMLPRDEVAIGQQVRVLPGERIPVDGEIIRGRAVVDEHFFTGESQPVEKAVGGQVLGGSLNLDGDLLIDVQAPATAGALGRLIESVRTARLQKGEFQLLADQWSARFFPIIAVVSLATGLYHGSVTGWDTGLMTALSVVLIACPCALALATPVAIWASLAHAAQRGVLFRSGAALERLAKVRAIRWDKTGTLTTGTPSVRTLICETAEEAPLVMELASALVGGSTHIYSEAIRRHLELTPAETTTAEVETVAGRGLCLTVPALGEVALGSCTFMQERGLQAGPRFSALLSDSGQLETANVCVGWGQKIRGVFLLDEVLRPETRTAMEECRSLGLDLAVLTGDRRERGAYWQQQLGIPVEAELLPEEKLQAIREAHVKCGSVAMVGDGLNDAPALAAADIGIALGCGADVTRDSADLCLLPNDLRLVPWSIGHARTTVQIIRQNLAWSFGYNSLGVILAASGMLHPAIAAILMVVSSLMVLGNSLRLKPATSHVSEPLAQATPAESTWPAVTMEATP